MPAARRVRTVTVGLLAVLLVVGVSGHAFDERYGAHDAAAPVAPVGSRLEAAVAEQEASGLHCAATPRMTDTVLVQWTANRKIGVVTFDQAMAELTARTAVVRGFCA